MRYSFIKRRQGGSDFVGTLGCLVRHSPVDTDPRRCLKLGCQSLVQVLALTLTFTSTLAPAFCFQVLHTNVQLIARQRRLQVGDRIQADDAGAPDLRVTKMGRALLEVH